MAETDVIAERFADADPSPSTTGDPSASARNPQDGGPSPADQAAQAAARDATEHAIDQAAPQEAQDAGSRGLKALLEPSDTRPEDHADSEWAHVVNKLADKVTGDEGDASSKNLGESVALCIEKVFGSDRWPAILYPVKAGLEWIVGLVRRWFSNDDQDQDDVDEGDGQGGYEIRKAEGFRDMDDPHQEGA